MYLFLIRNHQSFLQISLNVIQEKMCTILPNTCYFNRATMAHKVIHAASALLTELKFNAVHGHILIVIDIS